MAKIFYFILLLAVNLIGIIGLYGIAHDILHEAYNYSFPLFLHKKIDYGSFMMYGLPISTLFMLLQKQYWCKVIGAIYLIGSLGMLYLFGQAMV